MSFDFVFTYFLSSIEPIDSACVCVSLCGRTCWKQLRTLGSMLEPPKAATSPSCLGIWMASWSSSPSCRWSQVSPDEATWLKRSERRRKKNRWRKRGKKARNSNLFSESSFVIFWPLVKSGNKLQISVLFLESVQSLCVAAIWIRHGVVLKTAATEEDLYEVGGGRRRRLKWKDAFLIFLLPSYTRGSFL